MIRHTASTCLLGSVLLLSACSDIAVPDVTKFREQKLTVPRAVAPPNAKPGTCWGQDATPATVETVTEQILLQPAEIDSAGRQIQPAVYKTETRQQIVKERQEVWFETPCDNIRTPEFVASLHRALKARKLYRGAITGQFDNRTRRAIRRYQKPA